MLASIVIDPCAGGRYRRLRARPRARRSPPTLHFSSDLVASVLVLIGLTITWLGYPQADAYAAFGVALFSSARRLPARAAHRMR